MSWPGAYSNGRNGEDGKYKSDMKYEDMRDCNESGHSRPRTVGWVLFCIAIVALGLSVIANVFILVETKADIEKIRAENTKLKNMILDIYQQHPEASTNGTSYDAKPDVTEEIAGGDITMLDIPRERHIRAVGDRGARLKRVEEKAAITAEILRLRIKNSCKVFHAGKCFVSIIKEIKKNEAEKLCAGLGGHMANIYSQSHYEAILRIVPAYSMDMSGIELMLGMTYDITTHKVSLWDGTRAPFVKWLDKSWPFNADGNTQIFLRVNVDEAATHVGMFNVDPSSPADGVVCEI